MSPFYLMRVASIISPEGISRKHKALYTPMKAASRSGECGGLAAVLAIPTLDGLTEILRLHLSIYVSENRYSGRCDSSTETGHREG